MADLPVSHRARDCRACNALWHHCRRLEPVVEALAQADLQAQFDEQGYSPDLWESWKEQYKPPNLSARDPMQTMLIPFINAGEEVAGRTVRELQKAAEEQYGVAVEFDPRLLDHALTPYVPKDHESLGEEPL